jgi:hypothetical protein
VEPIRESSVVDYRRSFRNIAEYRAAIRIDVIMPEMPVEVLVERLNPWELVRDLRNCTACAKAEDTEEASTRAHLSSPLAERCHTPC